MLTLLLFAFLAGLAASLSPCVLVVLPLVLSSSLQKSKAQPIATIVGLTLSFAFFTLFLSSIIQATGISATALRYASIAIVFAFGLTLLIPATDRIIAKIFSPFERIGAAIDSKSRGVASPILSGLLLGVAIGLLWTPCAGPILASVISLVATQQISWSAVLIVLVYSIGSSLPLFVFALFGQRLVKTSRFLKARVVGIRRIFGVLMIGTSLLLFAELDTKIVQTITNYIPSLSFDSNGAVQQELEKLAPASNLNAPAPDFAGITHWINSSPLRIQSLRGKVVLVDFWTYSCINCVRTLPYLKRWYETYKDDGFVIVGVHSPEFAFEKEFENVERATKREGILYPVALDNDFATWRAFHNRAWPGHFLIDRDGIIREAHHGEGDYEETEALIRKLLGKAPASFKAIRNAVNKDETPETYLGYARAKAYDPSTVIEKDLAKKYAGTTDPVSDKVSLNGEFVVSKESITSMEDGATLTLNFAASKVYLVMSGTSQRPVKVLRDGETVGEIVVNEAKMYELLKNKFGRHLLTLQVPKGISAFAFTFGDD